MVTVSPACAEPAHLAAGRGNVQRRSSVGGQEAPVKRRFSLVLCAALLLTWLPAPTVPVAADTPGGTVVAWGRNTYGQTSVPAGLTGVVAVAAGGFHSLALKADGTAVAWGHNDAGQASVPAGLTGVVAIAAGQFHSLALRSDGTVVAWGYNNYGQASVPAGLTGVVAIAAGEYHSLALKADGTVVAWGSNGNGQASVPAGLTGVVAIAAGTVHSLALKADGTVVTWGRDNSGPAKVPAELSGVVAIAAGWNHNLALKADRTVTAWAAFGSESLVTRVPSGLWHVEAIAAGLNFSLAFSEDVGLATWGDNYYGQCVVPDALKGVIVGGIAAGQAHALAIVMPRPSGFALSVDHAAGPVPQAVTVGDLDGDGNLDAAVANTYTSTVSVLLGRGDGTFEGPVAYPTGDASRPVAVALADLDGDDVLDLAVADWWGDAVAVLLGKGDGTFATADRYTTGVSPQSVAVGDLNQDGAADLAVATEDSHAVSVLLGHGDGTFHDQAALYSTGTDSNPTSVAVGDLNGDGTLDLAAATEGSNAVAVLLGNGDGTFQPHQDHGAGWSPSAVTIADLDGDRRPDLAVANLTDATMSVLLGNGDGTFQNRIDHRTGAWPASVAASDLDGDGNLDLAAATQSYGGSVTVLLGNGDGTFQERIDHPTAGGPTSLTVGDLNGDRSPDLMVAKATSGSVAVLFNTTPFAEPNQPPTANAGGPYLAAVNARFTADGTASTVPDGDPLTYAWTFGGQSASGVAPTLVAPAAPGIYPLGLTVDDGHGGTGTASTTVVVYDPAVGFVTGGGWFASPAGAYTADPTLTGKATFGFVSKYLKGTTVPSGTTAFEFSAGDLQFTSTSYDWLVVNQGGSNAQFKGRGTINGAGDNLFMTWASDRTPDTFRIRIWTEDAAGVETVIYDNGTEQPLGGGSIVIHTSKQ
jgi:hypothetical protein